MPRVCVDASLVLLWLLRQELSPHADALWEQWLEEGREIVGPALLYAEVPSVLREAIYHQRLTLEEGEEAFAAFCGLGIQTILRDELHLRAWELGRVFNAPRLYDFQYVALAELEGCELWAADRRLVNLVKGHCPWARWVGEVGG